MKDVVGLGGGLGTLWCQVEPHGGHLRDQYLGTTSLIELHRHSLG